MASRMEEAIQKVLAYAADDSHGYELHSRDYDVGTDCAGLMRYYAAAVEGVDVGSYPEFGTWSERETLAARGWEARSFDYGSAQRGDVFLRALGDSTGHTVLYLGGGQIVGAEANKDGVHGDSSGREITQKAYYAYSYNWLLRPPAEFREESGGGSSASAPAGTYTALEEMNVRTGAGTGYRVTGTLPAGYALVTDGATAEADGYLWARYLTSGGARRWVALWSLDGSTVFFSRGGSSQGSALPAGTYTVTGPLNVRKGPGLSYAVTGELPQGYRLTTDGETAEADGYVWCRYLTSGGARRWVASAWLA